MLSNPVDDEVLQFIRSSGQTFPPRLTPERIPELRAGYRMTAAEAIGGRPIDHHERTITVPGGEVTLSVFHRLGRRARASQPAVFFIHGGGMVSGDRFLGSPEYLEWVEELGIAVVSVEYRLAPEHPDPVPVEDCYRGLTWMSEHSHLIRVDSDRIVVAGASAGGGLAAGVSLLSRDRRVPEIAGCMLLSPMLDDRLDGSASNPAGFETWDALSNDTGWRALLGARKGGRDVSVYAAPARSTDLSGLAPTYVDCGTAEIFHDQAVEYARQVAAAGGNVELRVWTGGVHGFDLLAPHSRLAVTARAARAEWLGLVLGL